MQREAGFSLIKTTFWLMLLGIVVWYGYLLIPVYNTYWKVQEAFESVSRNMADADEEAIRQRLPELFRIKYIAKDELSDEFYENLEVKADGKSVEISSYYHVTVWPLGPVESVDPDEEYKETDLKGMDRLRKKLRLDFDFEPYAETP